MVDHLDVNCLDAIQRLALSINQIVTLQYLETHQPVYAQYFGPTYSEQQHLHHQSMSPLMLVMPMRLFRYSRIDPNDQTLDLDAHKDEQDRLLMALGFANALLDSL